MDRPAATAVTPESAPDRSAVLAAQVDYLFEQLPRSLAFGLLTSAALVLMLWSGLPHLHLVAWFVLQLTSILLRLSLLRRYRQDPTRWPAARWARWHALLSGFAGLAWGSAGVIFFAQAELEAQALVLLVLAGVGAGSAAVLPVYLPAFYAFLPAVIIPVGVMLLLQADDFHLFVGVFAFIFLLAVLAFGRSIGAAFQESLRLRFEKFDLIDELEAQKRELERSNLAKSKFLAAASHDLRQPMHALALFSDLLGQHAADHKTRNLAEHIGSSVSVLDRLFSALLDISRIDAGVLKPEREVFSVREVVDPVVNDSLPKARERGLQLFVDCTDDYIESDPTLLERILRNLVTNAIRYTPRGNVTIRCRRVASNLQLSVIDTGVGIPEDQVEYIFEEFTQLENPERDRSKGLGLGLSIVRRLADLLGHPLEVQSQPGKGSRFSLTVPIRQPRAAGKSAPATSAAHGGAPLDLEVLVVDDDFDILEGTRRLLQSWGCTVRTAATAEGAYRAARSSTRLDAIVTDFRLPANARGTQVVDFVRTIVGKPVPALLVTGDLEPTGIGEARELRIDVLHKPVNPARLRAWLQKLKSV